MALGIGSGLHTGFFEGENPNRWMKRVFDSTQTSYSIPLWLTNFGVGWGGASDDVYTLKYDVYFVGPGYGSGDTDTVQVQMKMNGGTDMVTTDVTLDTVTSLVQTGTGNVDSNAIIMQLNDADDFPTAGDIFYIRDLTVEVKAADGTLKAFREWNLEAGGSVVSIDTTTTISSNQMDGAFSSQLFGQNPLA